MCGAPVISVMNNSQETSYIEVQVTEYSEEFLNDADIAISRKGSESDRVKYYFPYNYIDDKNEKVGTKDKVYVYNSPNTNSDPND